MTTQFRPLSTYSELAPAAIAGLDAFDPSVAQAGLWTSPDGCPGRTGRASSPLLCDRFDVVWSVPLGPATSPTSLLVGHACIVVEGRHRLAVTRQGQMASSHSGRPRAKWLDASGPRLLSDAPEGGLSSYTLPGGARECSIALSLPSGHVTCAVLPGPDQLLVVMTSQRTHGGGDDVVVEVVRAHDWQQIQNGRLYGLEPVAGMIREQDWLAEAALAATGPVLATADGILWCDWWLRPLAEHLHALRPLALSVDRAGRAFVIGNDDLRARHLVIVHPGGPVQTSISLPEADAGEVQPVEAQPVLVASDGSGYLVTPGQILRLSAEGRVEWSRPCGARPRAALAGNGLLLLVDDDLSVLDPAGERTLLWKPPAALVTPPILVGREVVVASHDHLFLLAGVF